LLSARSSKRACALSSAECSFDSAAAAAAAAIAAARSTSLEARSDVDVGVFSNSATSLIDTESRDDTSMSTDSLSCSRNAALETISTVARCGSVGAVSGCRVVRLRRQMALKLLGESLERPQVDAAERKHKRLGTLVGAPSAALQRHVADRAARQMRPRRLAVGGTDVVQCAKQRLRLLDGEIEQQIERLHNGDGVVHLARRARVHQQPLRAAHNVDVFGRRQHGQLLSHADARCRR
jgi:hypothetical protein